MGVASAYDGAFSRIRIYLAIALLLVQSSPSQGGALIPRAQPHRNSDSTSSTCLPMSSTTNDDNGTRPVTPFRLGYVTDVEGNLEYFARFVAQSKVLHWKPTLDDPGDHNDEHHRNDHHMDNSDWSTLVRQKELQLDLNDDACYFVYGGDVVDKGPGDIRLTRALVDLKRRYPDRVFLLVGNRDLNKVRFVAELGADDLERPLDEIPSPHWDPRAPSLLQYLTTKQQQQQQQPEVDTARSENNPSNTKTLPSIQDLNTRVNRLHYLLEHTLGCPRTFAFRRAELALLTDQSESHVTDDDVVDSFVHEIQSREGSLRQYLEVADVAVCVGNTLFCHGAVDRATMQFVPAVATSRFENPTHPPPPANLVDNVQEWTRALNTFLRDGWDDFLTRPDWNADRSSRGGESLMALQNRPAMWGRSIVSNCYGDGGCITTPNAAAVRNNPQRLEKAQTNPLAFEGVSSDPRDPVVAAWLLKDGIQRVVVGHKPTFDCPAVLSATYTGVEIVSCDTSFSDTSAADNRGNAVAVVEIVGESSTDNHLEVSGVLRDGSVYSTKYIRLYPKGLDLSVGDVNLGTQLTSEDGNDDWWIKAAVNDVYYLTRGSGRHVECKTIPTQDVKQTAPTALTRNVS